MDGSIKKAGGVFSSLLNRHDGGSGAKDPAHREPEIPEGWPRKLPFRKRPKPYSRAIPWGPVPERPALQISPTVRERDRPYELFVAQSVLHEVRQHLITASTDEPFGFLLGQVVYCPWTETPYVLVDAVRRETQNLPPSDEVDRFRHAWIGATRDARHRREQLIGWYHRHGVLGMRMSEWDLKLQDEFFPEPWQVALIVAASSRGPIGGFIQRSHRARLFRKGLAPFHELVDLDAKRVEGLKASVVDWANYEPGYAVHVIEARWPDPTRNAERWSEASHASVGVVPLKEPDVEAEVLEFPTRPEAPQRRGHPAPSGSAPPPEEPEGNQEAADDWVAALAADALASRRAAEARAREAEEREAAHEAALRAAEEAGVKAAEAAAAKAVAELTARMETEAAERGEQEAADKAAEASEKVDAALKSAEEVAAREAERADAKALDAREAERIAADETAAQEAERDDAKDAAAREAERIAAEAAEAGREEHAADVARESAERAKTKKAAREAKRAASAARAEKAAAARAAAAQAAAAEEEARDEEQAIPETAPPPRPVPVPTAATLPVDDEGIPVVLVEDDQWRPPKTTLRIAAGIVILLAAGVGVRALTLGSSSSSDAEALTTSRPATVFQQPPAEFTRLEGEFRSAVQDYRARYVAFQQNRASCETLAVDYDGVTTSFARLSDYSATRPTTSGPFASLNDTYRTAAARFTSTNCDLMPIAAVPQPTDSVPLTPAPDRDPVEPPQ